MSEPTVRIHLREAHLRARRPHQGLDLTAVRRRKLIQWDNTRSMANGTLEKNAIHGWAYTAAMGNF